MNNNTRERLDNALLQNPRAYEQFETGLLRLIHSNRTQRLSNHELSLLIPLQYLMATAARREFKLRFLGRFPHYSHLFDDIRTTWQRKDKQTPEYWDSLFEAEFNLRTAVKLKDEMVLTGLSVYQAKGRLQRENKLSLNDGLVSRYGIYISDRWNVGVRPFVKGSKFCQMEEVGA
jgi:hypothetical protein